MAEEKNPKSIEEIEKELKLLEQNKEANKDLIKLLEDRKKILQDITKIASEQEIPELKQNIEMMKALVGLESDQKKQKELTLEIAEQEYELAQKELLLAEIAEKKDPEKIKVLKAIFDEKQKQLNALKQINEQEEKRAKLLDKSFSFVSKITGGYSEQIRNLFTMNGILTMIGDMFTEVVKTNEQLAKTTGQTNLMTRDFLDSAAVGMAQYGVGYKEMGQSVGNLYTNMASFSNLNKGLQTDLAANAAKMENLGVSSQTTGKNFNELTKSLKFNANEVTGINDKIAKAAIGAGIAPSKMLNEFGSAMPKLASHGKKAVEVFIDLQKQAKGLGMEMGDLMGIIGDGFDTFEGAADKAGRLNAILGGDYLNSVEMLNATESERVEILRRSFEASGKNFESLDRFEKKSIAAALGVKDAAEAAKLLGAVSLEDKIALEKQAASQAELDKAQKAAADSSRQLQLVLSELLRLIEPLARGFKALVTAMAEHPYITMTAVAVLGLVKAFLSLPAILQNITSAFSVFGVGTKRAAEGAAGGIEKMGEGIGKGGQKAAPAIPVMLGIAGAIALIGVGVGAAALGLSYLADSFAKLKGDQIQAFNTALYNLIEGFVAFTVIMAGLAFVGVLEAAALGLVAVGAGVALIGVGIMIAANGMNTLVDAILKLVNSPAGANISSVFYDLAKGVLALQVSLVTLIGMGVNPLAWIGLASGLKIFSLAILEIRDAIEQLPSTAEFKAKVDTLSTVENVIKTVAINSEKLTPAKNFIDSAKSYYDAQSKSKEADKDSLVQALKTIMPSAPKEAGGGEQRVILRIENGPELRGYILGEKAAVYGNRG